MKDKKKKSEFVRFITVDLEGNPFEVLEDRFFECPFFSSRSDTYKWLKQFVVNELGHAEDRGYQPKHIEYMRSHDLVNYCDVSEKGHLKWLPKGVLLYRLLLDYGAFLAEQWGAFEMRNPMIIRGDHNAVGELMGEFHERDYRVDGGRGSCYLRYASDPLAFPFMQKVQFSYRQSPLKVFEEVGCFRNEQQGEVSGLKRVRHFTMTDMHAACVSEEEAHREFVQLCFDFADLMNRIVSKGRWVLGWEGTIDFYQQHKDWLIRIGKDLQVPAFFKLMPQMNHYFAMKNEFQAITADNANIQISTVQWDVKDGSRFDIGFVDANGEKHPCPVIIHASSFGSVERTLCAILENIAVDVEHGRIPMFPHWLAPTQVRIIPVSEKHLKHASYLCDVISKGAVRVDMDDRSQTLGLRIRDAEKEWVPYIAVVGDREADGDRISVRDRKTGSVDDYPVEAFLKRMAEERGNMPFRPLSLPQLLSRRPIFLR